MGSQGRPDARRRRLSRSGDFDRVYREGESRGNRFLVLYSFEREGASEGHGPRLGLSVGRKVGRAVIRNRVKRALREAFQALGDELAPGTDYVVVARPGVDGLLGREGPDGLKASLAELLAGGREERLS